MAEHEQHRRSGGGKLMRKRGTCIYNPILVAILVIFNISILGQAINVLYIQFAKTPAALEELDYEADLDGTYIRTPIRMIYGSYAYTTSGQFEKTESREYVIDAGSSYYMGLKAGAEDLGWTDALMNASFEYMDSQMDLIELKNYQYEITGTIRRIPKETLGYYLEFFEDGPEEQALPYYLVLNEVGHFQVEDITIMVIFDILVSAALVYAIVKDARRRRGLEGF